ncbi:MAG: c-type cytochrome [Acidobacteria bacterium]|nr:c-type cytochrome [Acidobacteriota bacterium]
MWWTALLLFQLGDIPEKNPFTSEADLTHGKKLYNGRCAGCHGPTGEGGKGANLAVPQLPRAAEDRSLYRVIRAGIPDTEMPGSLMDTKEIWQLAAYVRSLGRVQQTAVAGDAAKGAGVFRGKGCIGCHTIGVDGGRSGPSLTAVGSRRNGAYLKEKVENPAGSIPEKFRVVEISTKDGKKVNGQLLNEDTFSIQIRDGADRFHSVWREDILAVSMEHRTPMPAYKGKLSASELDDVVAYMLTLRGDQ